MLVNVSMDQFEPFGDREGDDLADGLTRGTLSLAEAAQRLGLTVRATRNAARAGEIPAVRIGRRWLVLRGPLEAMLLRRADPDHEDPM